MVARVNQAPLTAMADLLTRAGWAYNVFLRAYNVETAPRAGSPEIIAQALGEHARLGGLEPIDREQVIATIKEHLCYLGERGGGPDPDLIDSAGFKSLLAVVTDEVEESMHEARMVERFWLQEGHPAHPVFWDFAFLFKGQREAVLLIGSSSE